MNNKNTEWTNVISSDHSSFKLNLKEVWDYKDLVYMFVKEILSLALNKPFWGHFGFLSTLFLQQ